MAQETSDNTDSFNLSPGSVIRESFRDPGFLIVLVIGAVLIFYNLGGRVLWQDEAETAMYAKSILKHGVPKGFDGLNRTSQTYGTDLTADNTVRILWSPWIQFYISAAGVAVFGDTDFGPRMPFACFGFAGIWLIYIAARMSDKRILTARIAALALAFCVPYLLQARQAREYAVVVCIALGIYIILIAKVRRPGLWAAVAGAFFFYTNHILAAGFLFAICIAFSFTPGYQRARDRLFKAVLWSLPLALPGIYFILMQLLDPRLSNEFHTDLNPGWLLDAFTKYANAFCIFVLPLPVYLVYKIAKPGKLPVFLTVLFVSYILFLTPFTPEFFRYLMPILPFGVLLLAHACSSLIEIIPRPGTVIVSLLLFTNIFHLYPLMWLDSSFYRDPRAGKPQGITAPVYHFYKELVTGFAGPNREMVKFFKAYGQKGETLITFHEDIPLQYHTGLKVIGSLQGLQFPGRLPEWFIPINELQNDFEMEAASYFIEHCSNYHVVYLNTMNRVFANVPSPSSHVYQMPVYEDRLAVFVRNDVYSRIEDDMDDYITTNAKFYIAAIVGAEPSWARLILKK